MGRPIGLAPNRRGNVEGTLGRRRRPSAHSEAAVRTGVRTFAVPAWAPGERLLGASLVLLLVAVVALLAPGYDPVRSVAVSGGSDEALVAAEGAMLAAPEVSAAGDGAVTAPEVPAAPVAQAAVADTDEGAVGEAVLPASRILTYYGHPHDPNMGIVGEYPMEELLDLLRAEAANYEAIDPSRPVIPAFELIATVAQRDPGADGTYILDTDLETLTEYVDFAEANDALVFLDLQIGRGTVEDEIEKVRSLLERPHVHLALDPEFAMAEGETPGVYIGELTAEEITYAQETLAELSAELGLPPKVLIVHQFVEDMIVNKERLAPVPGVQLVIDADGYGAPSTKTEVYDILVRNEPIEFAGVKLFYRQDEPLMTPAEILALTPSPDVIIYQ